MIQILNLVNGEQIIGDVHETWGRDLQVKDPFYIIDTTDEEGNSGTKLINVLTFSDEDVISITNSSVVFRFNASEHMIKYYQVILESSKKTNTQKMFHEAIENLKEMDNAMKEYMARTLIGKNSIN